MKFLHNCLADLTNLMWSSGPIRNHTCCVGSKCKRTTYCINLQDFPSGQKPTK